MSIDFQRTTSIYSFLKGKGNIKKCCTKLLFCLVKSEVVINREVYLQIFLKRLISEFEPVKYYLS